MPRKLLCIWGQLRGGPDCVESHNQYVIDEHTDVLICCNCSTTEDVPLYESKSQQYSNVIDRHVYSIDMSALRDRLGVHVQHTKEVPDRMFRTIRDPNGVCMNNLFADSSLQVLYNSLILQSRLRKLELSRYSHVIIMRSDLHFVEPLVDLSLLDDGRAYTYKGLGGGDWYGGKFILLTVLPPALLWRFLHCHSPAVYSMPLRRFYDTATGNIERAVATRFVEANITFGYIDTNSFYISWAEGDGTHWGAQEIDQATGRHYKYRELFFDTIANLGTTPTYLAGEGVIHVSRDSPTAAQGEPGSYLPLPTQVIPDFCTFELHRITTIGKPGALYEVDVSGLCAERCIPFVTTKTFYIVDLDSDGYRGMHANTNASEVLVCLKGSCEVRLYNRKTWNTIHLSEHTALFINKDIWLELTNFRSCILLAYVHVHVKMSPVKDTCYVLSEYQGSKE